MDSRWPWTEETVPHFVERSLDDLSDAKRIGVAGTVVQEMPLLLLLIVGQRGVV